MADEAPATSEMKRSRDHLAKEHDVAVSLGRPPRRGHVTVKPSTYQPSKAELEEDMAIDTTPEELARVALQPMTVRTIGENE